MSPKKKETTPPPKPVPKTSKPKGAAAEEASHDANNSSQDESCEVTLVAITPGRSWLTEERFQDLRAQVGAGMPLPLVLEALGCLGGEMGATWQLVTKRYPSHIKALKRAAAAAEAVLLGDVIAGKPGWQGKAWRLERLRPERYSARANKAQTQVSALAAALGNRATGARRGGSKA